MPSTVKTLVVLVGHGLVESGEVVQEQGDGFT